MEALLEACNGNHYDVAMYILENHVKCDKIKGENSRHIFKAICSNSNGLLLPITEYLEFSKRYLNDAAGSGNLDTIQYFVEEKHVKPQKSWFYFACRDGHLNIVKYLLHCKKYAWLDNIQDGFIVACEEEHWQVMHYLLAVILQESTHLPKETSLDEESKLMCCTCYTTSDSEDESEEENVQDTKSVDKKKNRLDLCLYRLVIDGHVRGVQFIIKYANQYVTASYINKALILAIKWRQKKMTTYLQSLLSE
jgi:hypothetical protein